MLRVAKKVQSVEKTGASNTIKKEFTDWNQAVGISNPNTLRLMYYSVYKVRELPACSKPAQKNTQNRTMMIITQVRSFSSLVRG